jgi:hypothetical protein
MKPSEDEIRHLLDNREEALARWYERLMAVDDEGLILAGGYQPPAARLQEIFDRWFARRRGQLRELLCSRLGYAEVSETRKELGEIAAVTIVTTLLASASDQLQVDPLATAAVLVSRRYLDLLCREVAPVASPDARDASGE